MQWHLSLCFIFVFYYVRFILLWEVLNEMEYLGLTRNSENFQSCSCSIHLSWHYLIKSRILNFLGLVFIFLAVVIKNDFEFNFHFFNDVQIYQNIWFILKHCRLRFSSSLHYKKVKIKNHLLRLLLSIFNCCCQYSIHQILWLNKMFLISYIFNHQPFNTRVNISIFFSYKEKQTFIL